MKRREVWRMMACCLAGAVVLSGNGILAMADGLDTALAGVSADIESQEAAKEAAGVVQVEASGYDTTAIAQCSEYVNIRDAASTDGNILGKLYNNSAATILGVEGDWYLIQSGSVTGYVNSAYFVTGDDAEYVASQVGNEVATVSADGLMVRTDTSTDADVVTMVGNADVLQVEEDLGDWVKVSVDDDVEGYVAKEYIETDYEMEEAESKEEEAARIEAENQAWLEYLAEQEAQRQAEEQAWLDYLAQQEAAEQAAADAQAAADQAAAEQAAAEQAAAEA